MPEEPRWYLADEILLSGPVGGALDHLAKNKSQNKIFFWGAFLFVDESPNQDGSIGTVYPAHRVHRISGAKPFTQEDPVT